jgi:chemotaxis response regulator CheB
MPRILPVCTESTSCERFRQAFQSHTELEVYGGMKNRADPITKATAVQPNLIVLQMASDPHSDFEAAEKLKRLLPLVPMFLVTSELTMAAEKDGLARGIDAVLRREGHFTSLVMMPAPYAASND